MAASLDNCQGWLSADLDNFEQAILAKSKSPQSGWKIALLQDRGVLNLEISVLKIPLSDIMVRL